MTRNPSTRTPTNNAPDTLRARRLLFRHLHRGGQYAHLWTDAGNQSYWFRVDGQERCAEREVPRAWRHANVYFSVHPLSQIPPASASGKTDPRYIGSQLPYIAAINALFAEYDGKDHVAIAEYTRYLPRDMANWKRVQKREAIQAAKTQAFYAHPAQYKARAWAAIAALDVAPSVVVDSGGGYHCYWLLRDPVPVDDANRADIQIVQHTWVQMVGGDPGAADLRRLLRVPGTLNVKAGFGKRHVPVTVVWAAFDQLYDYRTLDESANDWLYANAPATSLAQGQPGHREPADGGVRAMFDRQHHIVDLLIAHGYQVSFATAKMVRLARPGRGPSHSSVTVFPAREDGTPELSVHFSTNDELYSEEKADVSGAQIKRQAHDAFAIYVALVHDGDWGAAYAAAQTECSI